MNSFSKYNNKKQAGFTLTELAIIFAVIGLLIGFLWTVGTTVWGSYHVSRTNQQIVEAVQGIRDYYGYKIQKWSDIGVGTPPVDITRLMDKATTLPVEMRRAPSLGAGNTPMDHDLNRGTVTGGSFYVFAEDNIVTGRPNNSFRLVLQGISPTDCTDLLVSLPLNSDVIGFLRAGTQGMAAGTSIVIKKGVSQNAAVPLPLTYKQAQIWCGNTLNEVDLEFALQN